MSFEEKKKDWLKKINEETKHNKYSKIINDSNRVAGLVVFDIIESDTCYQIWFYSAFCPCLLLKNGLYKISNGKNGCSLSLFNEDGGGDSPCCCLSVLKKAKITVEEAANILVESVQNCQNGDVFYSYYSLPLYKRILTIKNLMKKEKYINISKEDLVILYICFSSLINSSENKDREENDCLLEIVYDLNRKVIDKFELGRTEIEHEVSDILAEFTEKRKNLVKDIFSTKVFFENFVFGE
jgi:hypothetical protein